MRKEIEDVKDTAAVGLLAAVLGMEMGTELARKTLAEVSRSDLVTPPAPASPAPTEKNISVRAYQLWEQAGCPEGRDKEFYFWAERELNGKEALNSTRGREPCAKIAALSAATLDGCASAIPIGRTIVKRAARAATERRADATTAILRIQTT